MRSNDREMDGMEIMLTRAGRHSWAGVLRRFNGNEEKARAEVQQLVHTPEVLEAWAARENGDVFSFSQIIPRYREMTKHGMAMAYLVVHGPGYVREEDRPREITAPPPPPASPGVPTFHVSNPTPPPPPSKQDKLLDEVFD